MFIKQKEFQCEKGLIQQNQFTVHSIPKDYTVTWLNEVDPFIAISTHTQNNVLLIDANIVKHYQPIFNIPAEKILIIEVSEFFKTLSGVTQVLDFLQRNSVTKSEKLIVVGGGVLQEVAAFACAMYKRGIPLIHFPTTLLSMCDSCIGGKASLNYNDAKNQLGLYSTPQAVYINPFFLKTLDTDQIHSGLGEILKSCIIGGDYFLQRYRDHVLNGIVKSFDSYKTLIFSALSVKKSIVEADEFELDHRRALNYGHTFGHAIEALSNYEILHGQAVVAGMIMANQLSYQENLLNQNDFKELNGLCHGLLNLTIIKKINQFSREALVRAIRKDKKTVGQKTSFVLIKKIGDVQFSSFYAEALISISTEIS